MQLRRSSVPKKSRMWPPISSRNLVLRPARHRTCCLISQELELSFRKTTNNHLSDTTPLISPRLKRFVTTTRTRLPYPQQRQGKHYRMAQYCSPRCTQRSSTTIIILSWGAMAFTSPINLCDTQQWNDNLVGVMTSPRSCAMKIGTTRFSRLQKTIRKASIEPNA